jgi:mitotic spindle assembly checkpoint protein MAD2
MSQPKTSSKSKSSKSDPSKSSKSDPSKSSKSDPSKVHKLALKGSSKVVNEFVSSSATALPSGANLF